MKWLHVHDRIISCDACTSGSFWVLTVASLYCLKMEALIPVPTDCDKVFECTEHSAGWNLWSAVPVVITCRFSTLCCIKLSRSTWYSENCVPGGCQSNWHQNTSKVHGANIHNCGPSFLRPQEIPVWSAISEWQRGADECHIMVPISGGRLLRHGDTKVRLMVWQMFQFQIAQHLLYLFQ